MPLAKLSIDLEARLATLQTGLERAGTMAERSAGQMKRAFDGVNTAFRALSSALAVAGLGALFRTTINGIDALNDLKDATGATIENLSALEDIGARTGTTFETISATLIRFNKVLADAKPGSDFDRILKGFNLDVAELRRLDPAEALRRAAVEMARFADDGAKGQAFADLFGRTIQEIGPYLADLAKKGELVGTVTTKQAEEAEKFNHQLAELKKNSVDAARALTSDLLPAINDLFDRVKRQGGLGQTILANTGFDEASVLRKTLEQQRILSKLKESALDQLNEAVAKDRRAGLPENSAYRAAIAQLEQDLKRLRDESGKTADKLKEAVGIEKPLSALLTSQAGAGRGFVNPDVVKPRVEIPDKPGGPKKETELQKYIDKLEQATLAAVDFTTTEQLQYDLAIGKLGKLDEKTRAYLFTLAQGIDQMKKEQVKPLSLGDFLNVEAQASVDANRAANDAEFKKLEDWNARLKQLTDATPVAQAARLREEIKRLQDTLADAPDADQLPLLQALMQLEQELLDLGPKAEQAVAEMSEFAKEASRNIQDALGDTLYDTITGNFDSIGKRWGDLLLRMASEAVAAQIGEKLFGGKSGGGGLIGGFLDNGIEWLFSGIFHGGGIAGAGGSGRMVPALAFAGARRYHGGGMAGFAPDEVPAILRRGEEVLTERDPRHRKNAGAGGPTVNVATTMNINAPIDARQFDAILAGRDAKLKADIERQLRHRG